jgi:hypothetical protein
MKRVIRLNGLNKELELSKVYMVPTLTSSDKEFIYFEKLKDGTWRLTYTEDTISNIKMLQFLEIVRED